MELRERVALVTGSARRVGREIALALAGEGAHVAVHFLGSEAQALETVREVESRGVNAAAMRADLLDGRQVDDLFGWIADTFGRLDCLVNSAASFERRPFDRLSAEEWDRVMGLNLRAPFLCTQRAARLMRASDRRGSPGSIVNIADLSGVQSWRSYAHHSVSKAGLLHLTRVSARELAPDVRVNAVIPGLVLPPTGTAESDPAWLRLATANPLSRAGAPADVAGAVVFLSLADFVTGSCLEVDGGEHLLGPQRH